MVTWGAGATPRVLRSASAVRTAQANGDLTIRATSRVVDAPLLGFGTPVFARGETIHY